MQQSISTPEMSLPINLQRNILDLAAERSLMLPRSEFVCDYTRLPSQPKAWLMTAVRQQDMRDWQTPLIAAGLTPTVADITPCALRRVAALSGQSPTALLLHVGEYVLTWTAPFSQPLAFGFITRQNDESMPELIERAVAHAALQGIDSVEVLTCGTNNASDWSPFRALTYLQPPLPSQPEMFALAVGLALCEERTSWSR